MLFIDHFLKRYTFLNFFIIMESYPIYDRVHLNVRVTYVQRPQNILQNNGYIALALPAR